MSVMREHVASGLKWTAVSQASRLLSQLIGVLVLAHLLPPTDFGLLAMAATVTGFVSLFLDLGAGAAIVQKNDPSHQLLDSVFWLNAAFGVGLAVLIAAVTPAIAFGLAEPRLKGVLWLLVLAFPISSLGVVHQALLEKISNFRQLAILESSASFTGLAGAAGAALAGWGVYSLVLQTLLTTFLTTCGLWLASQWRPKCRWDFREIRSLAGFSGNLVGFNIFNYFVRNADNLLIGRYLGASDLGYYTMAYKLMLWPLQNISRVVGRAMFPVFSRVQSEQNRLAEAYVRTTAAIALICAPLMFGFFVLREQFVLVALGEKWRPVAAVLAWLVPVGLLQSIGTTVGTLYLATGRTDVMFKWGVLSGIFVIPSFVIGLKWGITGVAAAYCMISVVVFYPALAIPYKLVGLRVGDVVKRCIPSLISAAVMAIAVKVALMAWPARTDYMLPRLILLISLGILIYSGLSLLTQRVLLNDIRRVMFPRSRIE